MSHKIPISGDKIKAIIHNLQADEKINAEDGDLVYWFYSTCKERDWSYADAGEQIGRDSGTVSKLLSGKYAASYDNLIADLRKFKELYTQRQLRKKLNFIELDAWHAINGVCQQALYDSQPVFIYGASQIGKTACLEEFQRRNNHGRTKYFRMPATSTWMHFVRSLAKACYVSHNVNVEELRETIIKCMDCRSLLIVDEVHELFLTGTDMQQQRVLEFFREIYDRTGCGIVLCGTEVFKDHLEEGKFAKVFDQFRRRGMLKLLLPSTPSEKDILKVADAFGLPHPDESAWEIIIYIIKISGLGMYIKRLQAAHTAAQKRKEKINWEHFAEIHVLSEELASGKIYKGIGDK